MAAENKSNEELLRKFDILKLNMHQIIDAELDKIKQLILNQRLVRSEIKNVFNPKEIVNLLESFRLGHKTQVEANEHLSTILSCLEASEPAFIQQLNFPSDKIVALWAKTIAQISALAQETISRFGSVDLPFRLHLDQQSFNKKEAKTADQTDVHKRQEEERLILKQNVAYQTHQNSSEYLKINKGSNSKLQSNQNDKTSHDLVMIYAGKACENCGDFSTLKCNRCKTMLCNKCSKAVCS